MLYLPYRAHPKRFFSIIVFLVAFSLLHSQPGGVQAVASNANAFQSIQHVIGASTWLSGPEAVTESAATTNTSATRTSP